MHDSPGWEKASLEFKGSLFEFVTNWLIEYGWSIERFTVQWFTDPPKPSGWHRKYIENNGGGVSQSGKTNVIKSDQTDWIVSFCFCENCLFSNLKLNKMTWGTTKYQGIQNDLLASAPLNWNNLRCSWAGKDTFCLIKTHSSYRLATIDDKESSTIITINCKTTLQRIV